MNKQKKQFNKGVKKRKKHKTYLKRKEQQKKQGIAIVTGKKGRIMFRRGSKPKSTPEVKKPITLDEL